MGQGGNGPAQHLGTEGRTAKTQPRHQTSIPAAGRTTSKPGHSSAAGLKSHASSRRVKPVLLLLVLRPQARISCSFLTRRLARALINAETLRIGDRGFNRTIASDLPVQQNVTAATAPLARRGLGQYHDWCF